MSAVNSNPVNSSSDSPLDLILQYSCNPKKDKKFVRNAWFLYKVCETLGKIHSSEKDSALGSLGSGKGSEKTEYYRRHTFTLLISLNSFPIHKLLGKPTIAKKEWSMKQDHATTQAGSGGSAGASAANPSTTLVPEPDSPYPNSSDSESDVDVTPFIAPLDSELVQLLIKIRKTTTFDPVLQADTELTTPFDSIADHSEDVCRVMLESITEQQRKKVIKKILATGFRPEYALKIHLMLLTMRIITPENINERNLGVIIEEAVKFPDKLALF